MNISTAEAKKEIKCVVWDLDNTIWDGVLSEDMDVTLKPFITDCLKALDQRGILHSIASKNNYDDAMAKLVEFKIDHYFLYPQINWNAKSSSISTIQQKINIGMDTFLFIDDQPFERDEVNAVHPDVTCIDASEYIQMLHYPRLNPRFITVDSRHRRQMYQSDITRQKEEETFQGTSTEFLASLNMTFVIHEAQKEDLERAEELTVRTHQLNATGVTYNYEELNYLRTSEKHKLLVCELTDRYGSYGKIGLALIEIQPEHWHLKLLLMSCRVISRGVGTVLLNYIMKEVKLANKKLLADFKKTDRNRQMYLTYRFANFHEIGSDNGQLLLTNDLTQIQEFPSFINVVIKNSISHTYGSKTEDQIVHSK